MKYPRLKNTDRVEIMVKRAIEGDGSIHARLAISGEALKSAQLDALGEMLDDVCQLIDSENGEQKLK